MIVEPVTVLVLHCSRCNKPFTDYEGVAVMWWPTREVVEGAFADGEYDGWVKLGDRYLCGDDCWRRTPDGGLVEAGPLSAIDEAVVLRERAGYADVPASPVSDASGERPGATETNA